MAGLPENGEFMRYLHQWLQSPTDESCPLGGQAGYSSAVTLGNDNTTVAASHFRTFHTPLKSQNDFINALSAARRVSADITKRTGVKVFPYSLFYVFFDQYEHVESIAVELIALGIIAIAIITSVLLGSWRTGGVVTFTCLLAVINVMGVMGYWGVSLNAISLVNLVISLGIAVEFCSHIARAFMGAGSGLPFDKDPSKERNDRAFAALVDVGPSVSCPDLIIICQLISGILRYYNDQTDRYLRPGIDQVETPRSLFLPNVARLDPLWSSTWIGPSSCIAQLSRWTGIRTGGYR
jgi:Niemann-Pick C1 protein